MSNFNLWQFFFIAIFANIWSQLLSFLFAKQFNHLSFTNSLQQPGYLSYLLKYNSIHKHSFFQMFLCFDCLVKSLSYPLLMIVLAQKANSEFLPYLLLSSALIITIQSDFHYMLISRFASLYLIPTGFIFSYLGWLSISFTESLVGAIGGYLLLFSVKQIFYFCTKKDGMGQGDLELMALIGSYTGPIGCWFSLLIGSILGTVSAIIYYFITKKKIAKLPLGMFLSIGTLIFILLENKILFFFDA